MKFSKINIKDFLDTDDFKGVRNKISKDSILDISVGEGFLVKTTLFMGLDCTVKILPKNDKNKKISEKLFESEKKSLSAIKRIGGQHFMAPFGYDEDDDNYYLVYGKGIGDNLLEKSKEEKEKDKLKKETIKQICRQFLFLLERMQREEIYYSKENLLDNMFISKDNNLTILGLDQWYTPKKSYLVSKVCYDKKPDYGSIVKTLGLFCYLVTHEGKSPVKDEVINFEEDNDKDAQEFFQQCFQESQEKRNEFNPIDSNFLKMGLKTGYVKNEKKIVIGDFGFSWKDGLSFSIKKNTFYVSLSKLEIGISCGDGGIIIGREGLKLTSEENKEDIIISKQINDKLTLNYSESERPILQGKLNKSKVTTTATINSQGLKVESDGDIVTINGEGLKCISGESGANLNLGASGLVYSIGKENLNMGGGGITCTIKDFSKKMEGCSFKMSASGVSVEAGSKGFKFEIPLCSFELTTDPALILSISNASLSLGTEGLFFGVGDNIKFGVGTKGLRFDVGEIYAQINTEGIEVGACGYEIKFTFKGGVQMYNGNAPFDFKTKGIDFDPRDIPLFDFEIPTIEIPPIPKPPIDPVKMICPFCNIF